MLSCETPKLMACETTPQLTRLACALRSVSIWKYRSEALKCENKLLKEKLQAMELRLCAQHTSSKAPLVVYVSDDEVFTYEDNYSSAPGTRSSSTCGDTTTTTTITPPRIDFRSIHGDWERARALKRP